MPSSAMRRAAESARLQAAKASWLRCATKRQLRVKSSRLVRSMLHAIQATFVLLCAKAGCCSQTYAVPRWRCAGKRGTLSRFGVAGHCVHCSNSFRHRFARAKIRKIDKKLDDASSSRIYEGSGSGTTLAAGTHVPRWTPTPQHTHTHTQTSLETVIATSDHRRPARSWLCGSCQQSPQ